MAYIQQQSTSFSLINDDLNKHFLLMAVQTFCACLMQSTSTFSRPNDLLLLISHGKETILPIDGIYLVAFYETQVELMIIIKTIKSLFIFTTINSFA